MLAGYREKPEFSFQVSMGVYILDPVAWDFLAPGRPLPMPDLLETMRLAGHPVHCFRQSCYWLDIGRHDDYATANDIFEAPRRLPRRARGPLAEDRTRPVNPHVATLLTVVVAYLIGAIPFGYLTARWARGIDIRTVGSGNIGATNVGRALGLRFFVFVFALDLLKGFLPTFGFPRLVAESAGRVPPETGVLVALATILGHNFPVYLRFRGGKGVATSLGALLALDAVASAAAAVGFVVFLLITRYVSLSSLLGGLVFALAHFARADHPLSRDQIAMTILTIVLLALLGFRHRKNLARIAAGTEPKVSLRKKRQPPSGCVAWILIVVLAIGAAGAAWGLSVQAARRSELALGPDRLVEVARVGTGYQRAERLAFADRGRLLAVTCPRYDRLVLYRVTDAEALEVVRDIALDGQPVAVCSTADLLYVLERPPGDARHVEPGWWEAFDFRGFPVGSRCRAGMYPDDMAVSPDGKHALVLSSGRAEGDPDKPPPALDVFDLGIESPAQRRPPDVRPPGRRPVAAVFVGDGAVRGGRLARLGAGRGDRLVRPRGPSPDRPDLPGRGRHRLPVGDGGRLDHDAGGPGARRRPDPRGHLGPRLRRRHPPARPGYPDR